MDKDSVLLIIFLGLIIFCVVDYLIWAHKYDKELEEFKAQMVPGTKLYCEITDFSDPEDIYKFNAEVIKRHTNRQIIMKWSDGKETYEYIDNLYKHGWQIVKP